jgi:hypothetical protein
MSRVPPGNPHLLAAAPPGGHNRQADSPSHRRRLGRRATARAFDDAKVWASVGAGESRRLDLLAERLDPVTKRRIGLLGLAPGVRCLEIGAGRGSVARWLCEHVASQGQVTDLETGFLSGLALPNLTVLRPTCALMIFRKAPLIWCTFVPC